MDSDATETALERLFEPLDIGPLRLRNRLMMTTHGPRLAQDRYLDYLEARSRDVALVGVHAGYGMSTFPPGPGVFDPAQSADPDAVVAHPLTSAGRAWCESFVPVLREQAEAVRRQGALCIGQLHHAGASDHSDTLRAPVGPSGEPDEFRRRPPHPLSAAEVADMVEVYAEAGERVARAGLDGIEIHAGHGYLIHQFLSPLTNSRTDAYGGSPTNRLRFLLEILAAVRAATGDAIAVGVRIPGAEMAPGGLTNAGMQEVAKHLEVGGAAYLNVSNGNYTGLRRGLGLAYVAPGSVAPGPALADARDIRKVVGIPVGVAGRIVEPGAAGAAVADGSADFIGVTRALIADPDFFAKARSGRSAAINGCIACNECHTGVSVRCTVNPAAGRERELRVQPAAIARRVLVIGGGPAGLYCAAASARRGHLVTLVERQDRLGGALRIISAGLGHVNLGGFLQRLEDEVARQRVDVRLATEVDAALIEALRPDDVVLALGAEEYRPLLPGLQGEQVITGLEVLDGAVVRGGHVVVVGGLEDHLAPLLLASRLAVPGRRVTLLSEGLSEGERVEAATRFALVRSLRSAGVEFRRLAALAAVNAKTVVIRDVFTNDESELHNVDAVVLACGRRARGDDLEGLLGSPLHSERLGAPKFHRVGDCLAPRRFVHATMDGARLAASL